MEERPIPFTAAMVNAILRDLKRQTRRVCKRAFGALHPHEVKEWAWGVYPTAEPGQWMPWFGMYMRNAEEFTKLNVSAKGFGCKYGAVGDRLWVTEAWRLDAPETITLPSEPPEDVDWWRQRIIFHANCSGSASGFRWSPPFLLPRWASRILLEITSVRLERVQSISESDAREEGVATRAEFQALWDDIYFKRGFGWEENPYVWVISFRRI